MTLLPARDLLVTGARGLLGTTLRQLAPDLQATDVDELDVTSREAVARHLDAHPARAVLHLAAWTKSHDVARDPAAAISANIIGTAHIAVECQRRGLRLVFLSSDYVYADTPGPHREDEPLLPVNAYAWTKLGGECAVRLVANSLIIRTSFGPRPFPYPKAAHDKITSRLYVDEAAPLILELARGDRTGIVNLGGDPISILDHAKRTRPDVQPIAMQDLNEPLYRDTSLDLTRWRTWKKG